MSNAERPDKSKNLSVPVLAENSRDFCCGLWVSYWLNNLYHFEKTACFMGKRSKGDRFVFWIISFIVEGSVGCLHWQAPHFHETCRNWIIYALCLFCQTGFQMDNRLKVVRGILCSRHDLLAHASFNSLGEQNKTNKNHPFWYAVGLSPPAAFLWGWHLLVQLLPFLCISKVEENWRGHSPLWPSTSEISTEGSVGCPCKQAGRFCLETSYGRVLHVTITAWAVLQG